MLIPAQFFSPTVELTIPTGIPPEKVKSEIETHPVTIEVKNK